MDSADAGTGMLSGHASFNDFFAACGGIRPIRLDIDGDGRSRECRHFEQPFIFVGRSPDCDVQLLHADVSYRHAYIQLISGRLHCFDLESRKGVYWKSGAQSSDWIQPNEPIRIGPYSIEAIDDEFEDLLDTDEPPPVAGVLNGPPPEVRLQLLNSRRTTQSTGEYAIRRDVTIIGKSRQCKIRLDGNDVSRMHCSLVLTPSGLWAVDLLGRHGTRVGDELIEYRRLNNGDELRIGRYRLGILYPQPKNGSDREVNTEEQPNRQRSRGRSRRRARPGGRHGQSTKARVPGTQLAARRQETESTPASAAASRGVSESFVLAIVEQFTTMQRALFDQSQQQMMMLTQMLGAIHQSQRELIRDDLSRVNAITQELHKLQLQFFEQQAHSRSAMGGSSMRIGEDEHAVDAEFVPFQPIDELSAEADESGGMTSEAGAGGAAVEAGDADQEETVETPCPTDLQEQPTELQIPAFTGTAEDDEPEQRPVSPVEAGDEDPDGDAVHDSVSAGGQPAAGASPGAVGADAASGVDSSPPDDAPSEVVRPREGARNREAVNTHAWLAERMAKLESERNNRLQKIMRVLTGSGSRLL